MNEWLIEERKKIEAFFRKRWRGISDEEISDFGAYCVEQWLNGRSPKTSYEYLGIDYLRSFAHRYGTRGSSDMLSRPPGLRVYSETGDVPQLGADSFELRRFNESSALRDRRLSERERIVLILHYEWGFTLKEIGDLLAVSESRISQMLDQTLSAQKKRISAPDASEAERWRQRKEQAALSRELQKQFRVDEKAQRILEKIRCEKRNQMETREIETQEESEDIRPFEISDF